MTNWPKENRKDISNKAILFLISPFMSSLYSIRTLNRKSSYVVFFLTMVLFGIAFTVPSGATKDIALDGADYRQWFERYGSVNEHVFNDRFAGFISFNDGAKDFYFDTVAFYLSRITSNYHFMFMVFAIVFAYFLLKSFRFLTTEKNLGLTLSTLILAYLFLYNQIFNINGVRFWTAAWIGIYSIFQIFRNGNKRYWLLAIATPFFHGSYWIFLAVLLVARLTKNFERIWVILLIISFFVSNIAIEVLQSAREYLPVFLSDMVDNYTDIDYVKMRNKVGGGYSWIPYTFNILTRVYQSVLIFIFIKNSRYIRANQKTESIYLFLLVWATIFNFFSFVPSLGGRFVTFGWPLIAYIWLVSFKDIRYQRILYAMPFIFLWNFYSMSAYYSKVLNVDFFIANPFYLVYKYLVAT